MIRGVLFFAAVLSAFVFPWPFTALLALIASYFFAPSALIVGLLIEALYNPGHLPLASILGLAASCFMYVVRRVAKTRIIGA